MWVVRTSARVFRRLSKHSHVMSCHVMSFEACDCWIPCYLGFTFSTLPTSLCLQTQILFGKFRDQKCSSCVTFIYSAQRMSAWRIKIPFVYNILLPFLHLASNPGDKWTSSGFSHHGWFSLSAALLFFPSMKENCMRMNRWGFLSAAVHSAHKLEAQWTVTSTENTTFLPLQRCRVSFSAPYLHLSSRSL